MSPQNENANPDEIEEIDVESLIERIEALEKESARFKEVQAELVANWSATQDYITDLAEAVESLSGDSAE